ncbi:MAG TPA: LysR family transcriptional regulator, partial [Thermodesulfobacteriota bacterium]|nr:LysR family transcriptional regulator [Thermodesulfobacteriota bacterium]
AFGDGPYALLEGIEATGSLHRAAADMKMAYSKAWKVIRTAERKLGFAILERAVGGRSGGGSRITPRGRELMSRYALFRKEVGKAVNRIFEKRFRCTGPATPVKGKGKPAGKVCGTQRSKP